MNVSATQRREKKTMKAREKKKQKMKDLSAMGDSQSQYSSAVGLLHIAEEALPKIFSSSSLMHKFPEELKRHHRWLGVFFHFSPKFPRVLRVMALTTNILTMLFVQSLTYNLTKGDDGSCEALQSESECLAPRSGFATGTSQCFWTLSETEKQGGACAFVEPDSDLTVMVFVAVFSAIVSTPISLAADWLIHHVLAAPTRAVTVGGKEGDRLALVKVLPLQQSDALGSSELISRSSHGDMWTKTASVVPAPLSSVVDDGSAHTIGKESQPKKGQTIFSREEALWARSAKKDLQQLQQGVSAYRRELSLAQRKEWDEVWGLDGEGYFLKNNNNNEPREIENDLSSLHQQLVSSLTNLMTASKSLLSDYDNSVASSLLSELQSLNRSFETKKTRFPTDFPTEREKNKRLLFLFQQDLLPGISGQIIEAKDSRDEPVLRAVSRSAKTTTWLVLGSLNVGMLFYIFLFAVSQTVSRQRAWANSFVLWLVAEVLVVSSAIVFFMHVLLPLLAMRDVRKVKQRLLASLREYQQNVHCSANTNRNQAILTENKAKSAEDESKRREESSVLLSFNAAQYLFLSHKMAQLFPELKVAQIVSQFRTPWPKLSYRRTTDLSQSYSGRLSGINKSLVTVLMFFVTSFLSVPAAVQDIALQISTTAIAGYTLLLHVRLYEIYPVLIVVPVLVLAAIAHFFVKSSNDDQQKSSSLPSLVSHERDSESDKHQAAGLSVSGSTNASVQNVDKSASNGTIVDAKPFSHMLPPGTHAHTHQRAHAQPAHAHVTRRASVAQGIAVATIAQQALSLSLHPSESSHSLLSMEEEDGDSFYSISDDTDDDFDDDDEEEEHDDCLMENGDDLISQSTRQSLTL